MLVCFVVFPLLLTRKYLNIYRFPVPFIFYILYNLTECFVSPSTNSFPLISSTFFLVLFCLHIFLILHYRAFYFSLGVGRIVEGEEERKGGVCMDLCCEV